MRRKLILSFFISSFLLSCAVKDDNEAKIYVKDLVETESLELNILIEIVDDLNSINHDVVIYTKPGSGYFFSSCDICTASLTEDNRRFIVSFIERNHLSYVKMNKPNFIEIGFEFRNKSFKNYKTRKYLRSQDSKAYNEWKVSCE